MVPKNVSLSTRLLLAAVAFCVAIPATAQEPATRQQLLEQEQREKAQNLTPQTPAKAEQLTQRAIDILQGTATSLHPFFQSAYSGGGFTLGAGYRTFVSPYNTIDVRGSYTISGYKRIEAEFVAPRLFHRRGTFSLLGGWREATEVGFYGIGTANTSIDDKADYSFEQPYLSAVLGFRPTRKYLTLGGGVEYSQWQQGPTEGAGTSIETVYGPGELPGLGATATYLHTQGAFGFDWRTSPGYSRRGGFYGVTVHDYHNDDRLYGFEQVDYEAIQHVPILREAWVLSFHVLAQTTYEKEGQEVPFFMLPSVGGGSSLRGFGSWRFRDRHSLLLQGEWRIMVNRFWDLAFFYDAGKAVPHTSDLNLDGLKSDYGAGVRFHGPFSTPLRIEYAQSNEGHSIVFSSSAVF